MARLTFAMTIIQILCATVNSAYIDSCDAQDHGETTQSSKRFAEEAMVEDDTGAGGDDANMLLSFLNKNIVKTFMGGGGGGAGGASHEVKMSEALSHMGTMGSMGPIGHVDPDIENKSGETHKKAHYLLSMMNQNHRSSNEIMNDQLKTPRIQNKPDMKRKGKKHKNKYSFDNDSGGYNNDFAFVQDLFYNMVSGRLGW